MHQNIELILQHKNDNTNTIVILNRYSFTTFRLGVNIKQGFAALIFYKSLRISPNSVASAQVINLISTDTQRFEIMVKEFVHSILAVPFSIGATFLLCYLMNSWYPMLGFSLYFIMFVIVLCIVY